jgi:predicted TIM-barrel fold metal-dependent hydrolase
MIIDAHIHMFPEDIEENWDTYAKRDAWFKTLTEVTPTSRVREVYATKEEALAAADKAGIDHLVMQGWYWRDHELCRRNNDALYRIILSRPDKFSAFASINPLFGDLAVDEVVRCHEMGFSGIGELGPGGNMYTLDSPELYGVLAMAETLSMPVSFHVGEPVGHVYPGKDMTELEGFYNLAQKFPDLTFIFSHLGGGLPFQEIRPHVRKAFRNVYYDLAALPLLYDLRAIRAMIHLVGCERIVFGSDFPLTIYPGKTLEQDFSLFVEDIRENAGLSEYEWKRIMGENMQELLARSGRKRNG